jgi:uncharacterized protein (TIGR02117 family)
VDAWHKAGDDESESDAVGMRRLPRWLLLCALGVAAVAAIGVLATLRRGDPTLWPPAPGGPTVTVYVVSHGYHAGIALPRALAGEVAGQHGLSALSAVTVRFGAYAWLEVGWGDEGFYREVPTVASLNVGLALRALFRPGNPSVVHVVGVPGEPPAVFRDSDIVQLDLTPAGFARLAGQVDAAFARLPPTGRPDALGPGLYGPSLFYRAVGDFHLFNVCNHWIADLLDAAGVPTSRALATLPAGLLFDLKWRSDQGALPRSTR